MAEAPVGQEARARREAVADARLFLWQLAAFLLLAFLAWATGFSRDAAAKWLAAWRPSPGGWLEWCGVRFSFVAAWVAAYEAVLFPLSVLQAGGAEAAGEGKFASWCLRLLVGVLGEGAFLAAGFLALYALQRVSPEWWWLWAAGLYAAMHLSVSVLSPAWLLPALHPPRPLDEPELLEAVRRAGRFAKTEVSSLAAWGERDRVTVLGFGRRVRVVLPDTLAKSPAAETKAFFAAKALAARSLGADWALGAVNAVFAAGTLFLASRFTQAVAHAAGLPGGDGALGAFPLLAGSLFVLALASGLVYNALARALAVRSDLLAAEWLGDAEAARRAIAGEAAARGEPAALPAWAAWLRQTPPAEERMRAVDLASRGGLGSKK